MGLLFDAWAPLGDKRRALLERSWAGVFRRHLLGHLPTSELAAHFADGVGRPSKDAHVIFGVLILQQLHDLTDAATVEALALNLGWHYALDVHDEDDAYLCEKTLRNHRRLVIAQGLDEALFRGLTDELVKAFKVDTRKQRLDSTAIRSAMRTQTRLGTVVLTISRFLRELARLRPELHAGESPGLIKRYVDRESSGCFADTTPSTSKRRLPEAGVDLLGLVEAFRGTEAATLPSFALLERVLGEQFEVVVGEAPGTAPDDDHARIRVIEPKGLACDILNNPSDPDSSYNKHRGQGYLAQVMETYQEDDGDDEDQAAVPDLITHVALGKMNTHDSKHLDPALDDTAERGLEPQVVLADTHYGSEANQNAAAARGDDGPGVVLVSPVMTAKGTKRGDLTLERFKLDEDGRVLRCPAGHIPISTSVSPAKLQARFDPATCDACAMKDACPTRGDRKRGTGSRLQYTAARVRQRLRRLAQDCDAFRERYRWRAGVEATMSRLKHQVGLGRLRVRGIQSVRYAVRLRALGLNILRCAATPAA